MKTIKVTIILLVAFLVIIFRQTYKQAPPTETKVTGLTMGSIPYTIKYLSTIEDASLHRDIDSILRAFNVSLSTYLPHSELSSFNKQHHLDYTSEFLYPVLKASKEIFENTHGAYDPTVSPLIDAWGFGAQRPVSLDSARVDSLLQFVGFEQVVFDDKTATQPEGFSLDLSASAKGYALDVIADYFHEKRIFDYMIEIGGEAKCEGVNLSGQVWKIGIETPSLGPARGDLFATVFLKNRAIATSGNYRNYYEKDGKMIAHTISPFTGYTVSDSLLSASVFAPSGVLADGYATACMVLGLEHATSIIESLHGIDAFFIFSSEDGQLHSYATAGIKARIALIKPRVD